MRKILLPVICVFMMLCAVNVNAQNIVEMSGESTLEAESFTWAYNAKSNNDSASGGSYIYWDAGIGAAEQKITVVAERDGFYNFDVIAGANGVDNTHSSITFEINGKEKTLKASDIDSSGHSFSGYSGLSVKTFNVFDNVYLEQGENEIFITIGPRPGLSAYVLAQLDAFIFRPSDSIAEVKKGEVTVEAEDFDSSNNREIAEASGGKTVGFYDSAEDSYSIKTYVNVITPDEYNISIYAAADDGESSVLSYLDVKINGGESIRLDSSNCKITDLGYDAWREDLSDHPASCFMYNNTIYLEEGINVIEVILTENEQRGHIFGAVDCIKIGKNTDISGLEFEDLIIGIDETVDIALKNADGDIVTLYDVDEMSIEFDNENIAVSEDLSITGINMGKANIVVTAKAGEKTVTANGTVNVVGKSGLYINQAEKNENGVVVTLSASCDFKSDGSKILLLVYGSDNGMLTSLKQVATVDIEDINEGESDEFDMELNDLDENDVAAVFISDASLTNTLYGKTVIE